MFARSIVVSGAIALLLAAGCHSPKPPPRMAPPNPQGEAQAANTLFLNQKTFDPWLLTNTNPPGQIPAYHS